MNDQENIKQILASTIPCSLCGGQKYTTLIPINLTKDRKMCSCINTSLPVPQIKNNKLIFVLNKDNL